MKTAAEVVVNAKEEILMMEEVAATRATAARTVALMTAVMVQMEMTQVKTEEGHRVVRMPAQMREAPAHGGGGDEITWTFIQGRRSIGSA